MTDPKYDIEKYLKGELTPAEMHALEEKALRDPFLAEALEGATQVSPGNLEADLKKLQHALADRVQGTGAKIVAFWVWPARIAAGLLLIILSVVFIVTLTTRRNSEDDLALSKQSAPIAENNDEQKATSSGDSVEKKQDNFISQAKPAEVSATPALAEDVTEDEVIASSPSVEKDGSPATTETRTGNATIDDEISIDDEVKLAEEAPHKAAPVGALKKSEARRLSVREEDSNEKSAAGVSADRSVQDEEVKQRIVRGQVVSEDGTGLPGVNVLIKGTNLGTVTDASGNYQISVDEVPTSLVFSLIGFMDTELQSKKDRADVQLSVDTLQLSEVIIAGEIASDNQKSTYEMAAPSSGRKAFKQYLEKNMRYPDQALEKKVEGKVTIQFAVEPSGKLSDFKVIGGIGSGCDEEVIRLIKEGPKWSPAKRGNNFLREIVKVRMKFQLPDK